MTNVELEELAKRLLGNLVHYSNGKNHLGDDIKTVVELLGRLVNNK